MKNVIQFIIVMAVFTLCQKAAAHETHEKISVPGFRMESELASRFISDIKTATIRVYPTIIRSPTNTTCSTMSQEQAVAFLDKNKVANAVKDNNEINPGELQGLGQFQWCQHDMEIIGREVQKRKVKEEYILVMEILFPPTRNNRQAVFGIHCIILNNQGQNAYTFLLNSHHQMFVDANMVANDLSAESRNQLINKATNVGLEALVMQIESGEGSSRTE